MRKVLARCLLWAVLAPVIFIMVCEAYVRAFGEPRGAAGMLAVTLLALSFAVAMAVGGLRRR